MVTYITENISYHACSTKIQMVCGSSSVNKTNTKAYNGLHVFPMSIILSKYHLRVMFDAIWQYFIWICIVINTQQGLPLLSLIQDTFDITVPHHTTHVNVQMKLTRI